MTQQSYNNYISNMAYMHSLLGERVTKSIKYDLCSKEKDLMDLSVSSMMIKLISSYRLEEETVVPVTYSLIGDQWTLLSISYIRVATGQTYIGEFHVGDAIVINNGSEDFDDVILGIEYTPDYRYYLVNIPIVGGLVYTISKDSDAGTTANNTVSIADMKKATHLLNRIHDTNYCVDYILTT